MNNDLTSLLRKLKAESKEPGDLSNILQRIAKIAHEYFLSDLCVIFPMNPITGKFLKGNPIIEGKIIARHLNFDPPRKAGLTKTILKSKILSLENLPSKLSSPKIKAEEVTSVIGIGLYTQRHNKPLAVMYLDYRKRRKFSRKFKEDLRLFSELASSELQTTWFIRRYRSMSKIGQDINENFENLQQLFENIYEHVRGILDASYYMSLAAYNSRKDKTDLYVADAGKIKTLPDYRLKKTSVTSWVLDNLVPLHIGDFQKDKLPKGVKTFHVSTTGSKEKSGIFVPIKIGDHPLGVLSIQHTKANYYDKEDQQILELLANHIALALNNYRLLNDLRQLDVSGQVLTTELDPGKDIIDEVADQILKTTQTDLVTLYPYDQSSEKYHSPIYKGIFHKQFSSLKEGEATPAAIVHRVNQQNNPIFSSSSPDLYKLLDKSYEEGGKFPDEEKIKSTAALPLRVGTESVGVLFVNFRTKQNFTPAQKWVIQSLATYAAIAIRNSRLYQDLRERRFKELEDLRRIDQAISKTSLKSEDILKVILESTARHIKADSGVLLLHNKKSNILEPRAQIGNITDQSKLIIELNKIEGIANTAFRERRTIRVGNVMTNPKWKKYYVQVTKNTLSELDIPLVLNDVAIGVMNFESSRENAFSAEDETFMETLAGQAVIVVRNAIEYEKTQNIAIQRKALIETVNQLLIEKVEEDEKNLFKLILDKALKITETAKGTISKCDKHKREVRIIAQQGLEDGWPATQSFDDGIVGIAIREKRIINIDDISKHHLKRSFLDAFPGNEVSELVVPIIDGDDVIGVINLESENPYHYEEDDVELVSSLASLCAVAIKNAENLSQKKLASVGTITGNLSHKMNSPLGLIKVQIELIKQNCTNELATNEFLSNTVNVINDIASETIQVVQKLIEEAKRSFGNLEKISLKESVKIAIKELNIENSSITIKENIFNNKEEDNVYATPDLSNVFQNLMDNAIRHMPDGGKIYVTLENSDDNYLTISVEDTGDGVPIHMIDLIFLPITDRESEGHGFGLPLVKAYLEWIGGQISTPVRGRHGKFTKFVIKLKKA